MSTDDRKNLEAVDLGVSGAAKNLPLPVRALVMVFWRQLALVLFSLIDRIEKLEGKNHER